MTLNLSHSKYYDSCASGEFIKWLGKRDFLTKETQMKERTISNIW